MAFQKLGRPKPRKALTVYITFDDHGRSRFRLSPLAYERMGEPRAVFLEWDDEASLMRLVASSPDDPSAYLVGTQARFCPSGALEAMGVDIPEATAFPVTPDGPLALIANLTEYRS